MRICIFEDEPVLDLAPLTLSRPAFALRCGLSSLADKQLRRFGAQSAGALVRPYLAEICRINYEGVAVNDSAWLHAEPTILVNARWLPPPGIAQRTSTPRVGLVGTEVAFARLDPGQLADCTPETLEDCLANWAATLPQVPAGGQLLRYPWDIVARNADQINEDWRERRSDHSPARVPAALATSLIGPGDRLAIDPTARIEPFVLADTTRGPVVVGPRAVLNGFTRIEGPCHIGEGTHLLGANVRSSTIGPNCRIGGEVEGSVIQGYSNKAHDGFLGHSYLGEWVNLGSGTQCSDLRNDYGEVKITNGGKPIPTGQLKVGCFLGDHTKTGIGTLLNTGTVAGVFCQLLPGGLLPRYLPSFISSWNGSVHDRTDFASLMTTAATVMGRRGQTLSDAHKQLYRSLFEQTASERRRLTRGSETIQYRRSV